MYQPVETQILEKIKKSRKGSVFFVQSFSDIGNAKAVSKALQRLVEKQAIARVATGIYVRPRRDPLLGLLQPTTEVIAMSIAKRDKARIVPAGAYALNKLGLSSQVPLNAVFLTDGAARKINIGNRSILFKKTSPKNLSAIGKISSLVIQALRVIGKGKTSRKEEEMIIDLLKKEKVVDLRHDIRLAPEWIRNIMKRALPD